VQRHVWVRADQLTSGVKLRTPVGKVVRVIHVSRRPGHPVVRDLTVADFHTFYVSVGDKLVFVHNNNCRVNGLPHGKLGELATRRALLAGRLQESY
jgi:hypothetical protein